MCLESDWLSHRVELERVWKRGILFLFQLKQKNYGYRGLWNVDWNARGSMLLESKEINTLVLQHVIKRGIQKNAKLLSVHWYYRPPNTSELPSWIRNEALPSLQTWAVSTERAWWTAFFSKQTSELGYLAHCDLAAQEDDPPSLDHASHAAETALDCGTWEWGSVRETRKTLKGCSWPAQAVTTHLAG